MYQKENAPTILLKQKKYYKHKTMKLKYLFYCSLSLIVISSCQSKDKENNARSPQVESITTVARVVGIGKVEPQNGIVNLASDVSGIIEEVNKLDGDSVRKGEIILVLKNREEQLKVAQIQQQMKAAQQTINANLTGIHENEIQLENKATQLARAQNLLKVGGETQENVQQLQTDQKVLQSQLQKSKAIVSESRANLDELKSQLAIARQDLDSRIIRAPSDGMILNMNVRKGEALTALSTFATLAPDEPMVVHGEADEMFANQLKPGQSVTIYNIGDNARITTGKIISLSYSLSNKSLFSDEPGEQQDRRVRRFKVLLDSTSKLLINTKVSCDIAIH